MYTISEEFREKIAKAREDYKAGKGVTCKTFEQSMALLESKEPNEETKEAIAETRAGKNLKTVDMSSFDNFIKSCSE